MQLEPGAVEHAGEIGRERAAFGGVEHQQRIDGHAQMIRRREQMDRGRETGPARAGAGTPRMRSARARGALAPVGAKVRASAARQSVTRSRSAPRSSADSAGSAGTSGDSTPSPTGGQSLTTRVRCICRIVPAMKLFEGRTATLNLIRSYGAEGVVLMAAPERLSLPLVLTASHVSGGVAGRSLDTLTDADVSAIEALAPNLVLVGGASDVPRVPAALRQRLESKRIAVEAMQLGAACRTFNVLLQEDRAVLALLLP